MEFGEKLKRLRKEKNLTQEELGKELYVSRATVSSWEVGRTYPDVTTLIKISDLFSVSLDILLREDRDMVKTIDKKVKENKKLKHWLIALGILFVLWAVGTILYNRYPIFEGYQPFPISEIKKAEVDFENKKATLNLEVTPQNFRSLYLNDAVIRGEKAYFPIFRKTALFRDSSESFDLNNRIDTSKISEIYIVTDGNFPDEEPKEGYVLKIWEK